MKEKHRFNFFPEISAEDAKGLRESIAKGFDVTLGKITLYEGKVLDGWNRYKACVDTGVEPVFTTFHGNDMEAFNFSVNANLDRRHLTSSQKAAMAVSAEPLLEAIEKANEEERIAKIAEARKKAEAEKRAKKEREERERLEAIRREEARKAREAELKKQQALADERRKKEIEAERLRIEEERKQEEIAKAKRLEEEKQMAPLMAPSTNREEKTNRETRTKLANAFGTSKTYISDIKRIKQTSPELYEEVLSGKKTITEVKKELKKEEYKRKVKDERVEVEVGDNIKNGDSLEILESLEDGCIDIVLTDPPYGISYKSNRTEYDAITKRGLMNDGKDEAFDLLDKTCEILSRKTAANSHLYFFCSWSVFSDFERIISKYFTIKTPIIWDKGNKGSGDLENDWGNQTEIALYCVKGKKLVNTRRGNVINIPRMHTSKMVHPTQKPDGLIKEILDVSYADGDFVVDPFMGSGSTIKVCNQVGAKSLGIELDAEMFNIANNYINGQS